MTTIGNPFCECGHRQSDHVPTIPDHILCLRCCDPIEGTLAGCEVFRLSAAEQMEATGARRLC